ncbi:MAG: diacylglycerol kinase family lipid kinase [Ruminococcaceae bacterium]|nr:diacylglycerol kinase family lipid kinase [Oscillospiraceae bacterium]
MFIMSDQAREKVLFIVNPKSGKMIMKKKLFEVVKLFSDSGFEPTVLMTQKRGDASIIAKEHGPRFDRIVSCGGDGTLNEVVTGLMELPKEARPPLGFIPAGTTNDLASTLGIPTKTIEAAKTVIENKPIPNDVGFFNNTRYFNYIASCGAFAATSYSTPQGLKNTIGHSAYILEGIKDVTKIRSMNMKLEMPDKTIEGKFIFVAITNALSMGGVYKLKPETVNLQDGEFEVLLVRKPSNPAQTVSMLHQLTRHKYDKDHVLFYHTPSIKITADKPIKWTVDGEFGGELDSVTVKNMHGAISIFKPVPKIAMAEKEKSAEVKDNTEQ